MANDEDFITDPIEEAIFLAHHTSRVEEYEVLYAIPATYMGQTRRTCLRCKSAAEAVREAMGEQARAAMACEPLIRCSAEADLDIEQSPMQCNLIAGHDGFHKAGRGPGAVAW